MSEFENSILQMIEGKIQKWKGGAFGPGKYTGARGTLIDFFNPDTSDIPSIGEIAIALANQSRWGGHIDNDGGYSVASHSLWVADVCKRFASFYKRAPSRADLNAAYLAGLTHDIEEGVCQDLVRPVKHHMGEEYRRLGKIWRRKILDRFGISEVVEPWLPLVNLADDLALPYEDQYLRGGSVNARIGGFPDLSMIDIPKPQPEEAWCAKARWFVQFVSTMADLDRPGIWSTVSK